MTEKTVNVRVFPEMLHLHGTPAEMLAQVLSRIPLEQREQAFREAVAQVEGEERRKVLLSKLDGLPTDELERRLA
jgi:hypothetical protein